jgi:hypothetical protein
VLHDAALNEKLAQIGLSGATLIVRTDGQPERVIAGDDFRRLVRQLDLLDTQVRILGRRGVSFERLVREHRKPGAGMPKFMAANRNCQIIRWT